MPGKREFRFILGILIAACLLMAANTFIPRGSGKDRIAAMQKEDAQKAGIAGVKGEPEIKPTEPAAPAPEDTARPDASEAPAPEDTARPDASEAPAPEDTARSDTSEAPAPEETAQPVPAGPAGPVFAGPMPAAPKTEVRGYVVITIDGRRYGEPIPMDRDKIITVRQSDQKINRVHITPDSVRMASSTCENQDCVGQGVITLENYKTRILSTYIICLPNGVQVEMVPVEE